MPEKFERLVLLYCISAVDCSSIIFTFFTGVSSPCDYLSGSQYVLNGFRRTGKTPEFEYQTHDCSNLPGANVENTQTAVEQYSANFESVLNNLSAGEKSTGETRKSLNR